MLKKLPELGSRTAAELSLDAVKAFREDALEIAEPACEYRDAGRGSSRERIDRLGGVQFSR